jgi:hypothetical protein
LKAGCDIDERSELGFIPRGRGEIKIQTLLVRDKLTQNPLQRAALEIRACHQIRRVRETEACRARETTLR